MDFSSRFHSFLHLAPTLLSVSGLCLRSRSLVTNLRFLVSSIRSSIAVFNLPSRSPLSVPCSGLGLLSRLQSFMSVSSVGLLSQSPISNIRSLVSDLGLSYLVFSIRYPVSSVGLISQSLISNIRSLVFYLRSQLFGIRYQGRILQRILTFFLSRLFLIPIQKVVIGPNFFNGNERKLG